MPTLFMLLAAALLLFAMDMEKQANGSNKPLSRAKVVAKWALITLAGIILYLWGAEVAYIERGYKAHGSECFLLLLPLWWLLVESIIDGIKQGFPRKGERENG